MNNYAKLAMLDEYRTDLFTQNGENYLVQLEMFPYVSGYIVNAAGKIESLRSSVILNVYNYDTPVGQPQNITYFVNATFNNKPLLDSSSENAILTTLFIAALLITGSVVFNNDAQTLGNCEKMKLFLTFFFYIKI